MSYISIKNNETIPIDHIPELDYPAFLALNTQALIQGTETHCVNYFGFQHKDKIKLICCMATDGDHAIHISSCLVDSVHPLPSFTQHSLVFEKFERELHENFGIRYTDHPWLKPVRFSFNRFDKNNTIADYPFFTIESEELHEVGVGPIHAGVIEPGHFRFICNGEQILHLEIQLGYQHRGIESLFLQKKKLLQRITLAENITGDCVAGHTVAFVNLWESLCGFRAETDLQLSRTLALELERIAIHTGVLSAMCTDIGYQLGNAVFGRLRTPLINYFQIWCGNRLGKGLIRPGHTHFPFTPSLADELNQVLDQYEKDFEEMASELFSLPSALARFDKTGAVTKEHAETIGAVGMTARMTGINRDIRLSHPHDLYSNLSHQPVISSKGDVYARARIRKKEINQSIGYIREITRNLPSIKHHESNFTSPSPHSFSIGLVEGWRGEICHCAITGHDGELIAYKIKDPSFHNWLALALAVRNNEISDFPISNKSFDLSYCGHDL